MTAETVERDAVAAVVAAAAPLDLAPRGNRWTQLSLCVLDAVYLIGASYEFHTQPTVLRYAAMAGLPAPYGPAEQVAAGAFAADEVPVSELAEQVAARKASPSGSVTSG